MKIVTLVLIGIIMASIASGVTAQTSTPVPANRSTSTVTVQVEWQGLFPGGIFHPIGAGCHVSMNGTHPQTHSTNTNGFVRFDNVPYGMYKFNATFASRQRSGIMGNVAVSINQPQQTVTIHIV